MMPHPEPRRQVPEPIPVDLRVFQNNRGVDDPSEGMHAIQTVAVNTDVEEQGADL